MKKLFALLLCLSMLLVGAAALAEETQLRAGSTLVVCASQDWIKDYNRKLAKDFTAETGVNIDFQLIPNDQYGNVVKAKLASGDGVDIFFSNPGLACRNILRKSTLMTFPVSPGSASMRTGRWKA